MSQIATWTDTDRIFVRSVAELQSRESTAAGTRMVIRASTPATDHDEQSIDPTGWLWSEGKLPPLLFGHDASAAEKFIGKGEKVWKDPSGLYHAVMLFDKSPTSLGEIARQIAWLYENHPEALSNSVGFKPSKWTDGSGGIFTMDDPHGVYPWMPGVRFLEQWFLEDSIVPVPANIDAMPRDVQDVLRKGLARPAFAPSPAPVPVVEPLDRLKALADELGVDLEMVEYDPAWLAVGIKKPLPRPIAKVGAVLSQANKTQLLKVWDLIATIETACEDAETALSAVLGSATPADESEAA